MEFMNRKFGNIVTEGSLVEKARALPAKKNGREFSEEELELAVAWLKGTVTTNQVGRVMTVPSANIYTKIASMLLQAYQRGLIK